MMEEAQQVFENYLEVIDKFVGASVTTSPQALIFAEALIVKANEILVKHNDTVQKVEEVLIQFNEKPPTLH